MNTPVLTDAALADAPKPMIALTTGSAAAATTGPTTGPTTGTQWRRLALPLGLGLLLLAVLFASEVVAAVQTWNTSTAYNHCFLIIPITLYLLWDRRYDLVGIQARPDPAFLLLGLPLAAIWLLAERLGVMEGRQLAAISFIELLFLAILGKRLWWAMAGPLLYLYFLVPFGEFLTPRLQDITTWFIRQGVDILGIPAYIDGYIIEIPQGTFFVAEACAGLRFLIASIAFGCLYALMMYRGPVRRGVFILASIIVPVIANGFRALGIVCLGYLLDSTQAAAADHVIYGWVFFSIVILLLIALGLPFRQDEIPTRVAAAPDLRLRPPFALSGALIIAAGVVIVAAITPAVATALTMATGQPPQVPAVIDLGPGCVLQASSPPPASSRLQAQRAVCGGVAMDITWGAFSPRITAAPLMAQRRRMVLQAATEGLSEDWLETADIGPSAWRIMRSNDPAFVIAVSVWVGGKPTRPGMAMRARMAMNSLFGSAYTPMVVTVTPAVNWDDINGAERKAADASLVTFLLSHPDLDRTVGTLSAR